ncbi:hypothetical protein [Alteraurantiacibacter aquimixticola]|uniref:DUF3617 family protein n=1 Tax=Alteraurantiacibacter aquimixticola TaxID=2489173 RepID=A0A4T3F4A5_9SPHN|nr:hypothetical protein [Alteraurantiacibacter aquimixticola]TIX50338.1 hypothetical protein E5222_08640 [Alteraurantiacibacter aquimixticola]
MKRQLFLACAGLAALVPVIAAEAPLRAQETVVNESAQPERRRPHLGLDAVYTTPFRAMEEARRPESMGQVRIRQRVIIRVSPSPPDSRDRMLSLAPRNEAGSSVREVRHDDCVEVDDIVGVEPTSDNRLVLFMENRQVLKATLNRSCTARAFYSGFYVERNEDGRLCVARDQLQSRAGQSCLVEELNRLVITGN